jgi:D-sedoheptulose 7-phosphate isomerase
MIKCLLRGGKIIWMGNGGSSSDSQHLAAELVGRFRKDRDPISSISLSSNMSIVTAVANDMGYDSIFSRQLGALCRKGDVVVGISTSGNSVNVLEGIRKASSMGACCIGFTGRDGGVLKELVEECIRVPSDDTARIQEAHILAGHIICDLVEEEMSKANEVLF